MAPERNGVGLTLNRDFLLPGRVDVPTLGVCLDFGEKRLNIDSAFDENRLRTIADVTFLIECCALEIVV